MDVNSCKIVNTNVIPKSHSVSSLLSMLAITTVTTLIGLDDNGPDTECLVGWASINSLTPYTMPKMSQAFTLVAETLTLIQI